MKTNTKTQSTGGESNPIWIDLPRNEILQGDCLSVLKTLPSDSVDCCVSSPPYWGLRDYGVAGQLGHELTPGQYVTNLCDIYDEVKRVLKPTGTCWLNLGDTYSSQRWTGKGKGQPMNKNKDGHRDINPKRESGLPPKCLVNIPHRVAIEMTNRGWIQRNSIIWYKPSCMPSPVSDRYTVDYEMLFFFTKSTNYYFKQQREPLAESSKVRSKYKWTTKRVNNQSGIDVDNMEGRFVNSKGRNKRCVWRISPAKYKEAHFATYPEKLIQSPIDAGCPVGGIVLDPFFGSGTTGLVSNAQGKDYIGIELNPNYIDISKQRLSAVK